MIVFLAGIWVSPRASGTKMPSLNSQIINTVPADRGQEVECLAQRSVSWASAPLYWSAT